MLQKVAACTTVAQELRLGTALNDADIDTQSREVCADAALKAALDQRPIRNAVSPALAKAAIETFNQEKPTAPTSEVAAAQAWATATEKVLASLPKAPAPRALSCASFTAGLPGVRCAEVGDGVVLDFNASFAIGQQADKALELELAKVADLLNAQPHAYQLMVEGYVSRARYACAAAPRAACTDTRNQQLAQDRARWAEGVLTRRLVRAGAVTLRSAGVDNPLSYDTAADRKIRLLVRPASHAVADTVLSLNQ